jgi:thioredoxin-related protein
MRAFFFIIVILSITSTSFGQQDSITAPPYKRFPVVPPFNLLGTDSVSLFTKADLKKHTKVLVMLFNPGCDHCKHETEAIIQHIDDFRKVQIVMATTAPVADMREFYSTYNLDRFNNIKVGQDFQYILPTFFMIRNLPFLAMYDKKGNLITTFEGTMKIEDLIAVFK